MSKMALNIAHFKKGAVGSIAGHNWYKRGEKDQHSNQDIDPTRSKENIGLVVPEKGSLYQDVKAMVDGATGRVTANSVWLSEWVLYPPEHLQDPKTADRAELRRYYQDALDWMQQQGYHVRLAAVHLDETTVHAHIDTVPLTKDGRLSRKDVYTRANLNKIHTELAEHLASKGWDIQRGESTQGKQVRAQSVPEYKKQAEAEKMAALERTAELRQDIVDAQKELTGLEGKVKELEAQTAPPEAVEAIEPTRTITGAVKLSQEDYQTLRDTAESAAYAMESSHRAAVEKGDMGRQLQWVKEDLSKEQGLRLRQKAEHERQLKEIQENVLAMQRRTDELMRILRIMIEVIREDPKADQRLQHKMYTQEGDIFSRSRINWKTQAMIDEVCGTNYAAQAKARYFAEHPEKAYQRPDPKKNSGRDR